MWLLVAVMQYLDLLIINYHLIMTLLYQNEVWMQMVLRYYKYTYLFSMSHKLIHMYMQFIVVHAIFLVFSSKYGQFFTLILRIGLFIYLLMHIYLLINVHTCAVFCYIHRNVFKNLQISFYVHLQQTTTLVGKGQQIKCIYIKLTPLVMAAGNLDYKSKAYIDVDN